MKTKILLWSVISVLSTAIGGELSASNQTDVIQLDADTKLSLIGLTRDRGEVRAPGFERSGTFNPIDCGDDTTVAWIRVDHKPGTWPSFELLVYDTAKTACTHSEPRSRSHIKDGVEVHGFVLDAFPRWDKEFILRARYYQRPIADGQFVVTNPHPVSVARWTAEPLPITKSDGDLEVTLTQFVAGAPFPYRQSTPDPQSNNPALTDVARQCVHLNFEWRQNGQPATNWSPWPVRTSDAAGNRVGGVISGYPKNGIYPIYPDRMHPSFPLVYDGYFYQPGLWPGQSPWKVQMQFTRRSGFSADETVTLTNLAVRPGTQQDFEKEWSRDESKTNFNFIAEGLVNGVKLKVLPPLLLPDPDHADRKHISVIIYTDPDEVAKKMNLTLLQATDEQGREVTTPFSSAWAGHFDLEFPDPRDVKTLNLKLALHKSRFVEFTVKPTPE